MEEVIPGSDGSLDAARREGKRACQETSGRVQAYGAVRWETRAIWRKLDCLKLNPQKMQVFVRRKDV